MDYFIQWLMFKIGYENAILVKNILSASAYLLIGGFIATVYSSYAGSKLHIDDRHDLKEDGISMLIMGRGKKTKVVIPKGCTSQKELFLDLFIFFLHQIGVIKNARINRRDIKRAKILFSISAIIIILFVITAVHMSLNVALRPEPLRLEWCKQNIHLLNP